MSYNGWSNYQTWNCNLWLEESGIKNIILDQIECYQCIYDIENDIKSTITNDSPLKDAGIYTDLLTHAINQIDFNEITSHIWENQ